MWERCRHSSRGKLCSCSRETASDEEVCPPWSAPGGAFAFSTAVSTRQQRGQPPLHSRYERRPQQRQLGAQPNAEDPCSVWETTAGWVGEAPGYGAHNRLAPASRPRLLSLHPQQ